MAGPDATTKEMPTLPGRTGSVTAITSELSSLLVSIVRTEPFSDPARSMVRPRFARQMLKCFRRDPDLEGIAILEPPVFPKEKMTNCRLLLGYRQVENFGPLPLR